MYGLHPDDSLAAGHGASGRNSGQVCTANANDVKPTLCRWRSVSDANGERAYMMSPMEKAKQNRWSEQIAQEIAFRCLRWEENGAFLDIQLTAAIIRAVVHQRIEQQANADHEATKTTTPETIDRRSD
jgi:hypothetical protein